MQSDAQLCIRPWRRPPASALGSEASAGAPTDPPSVRPRLVAVMDGKSRPFSSPPAPRAEAAPPSTKDNSFSCPTLEDGADRTEN